MQKTTVFDEICCSEENLKVSTCMYLDSSLAEADTDAHESLLGLISRKLYIELYLFITNCSGQ